MILNDRQREYVRFLVEKPAEFGHILGFNKLTDLHNGWMREMLSGKEDMTLLAHRLSYKTTCVSIVLAIYAIVAPRLRLFFLRKTDSDVKEITQQVQKILTSPQARYFAQQIYGIVLTLPEENATKISTNLVNDVKGTSQITTQGIGGSITGKHFDRIFTDDIVNLTDRVSKAERDRTKLIYMELQNIRNPGGRIINTGTPWHKDDAISDMPNVQMYDCYSTGLMSDELIAEKKSSMTSQLFAANYELRHIAADDVIFADPKYADSVELVADGATHVDAAYGGSDSTAMTVFKRQGDDYYIYGRIWQRHVDDCMDEIIEMHKELRSGKLYCEDNGDKGYLAKEFRQRGLRVVSYHEDMNKFTKITAYLKPAWKNVYFVPGTDAEYINEILDFNENAEHDDAPDSAASGIRKVYFARKESDYKSPFGG